MFVARWAQDDRFQTLTQMVVFHQRCEETEGDRDTEGGLEVDYRQLHVTCNIIS